MKALAAIAIVFLLFACAVTAALFISGEPRGDRCVFEAAHSFREDCRLRAPK